MRIRVIGLGEIGIRVAANAVRRGHEVSGVDTNRNRLAQAIESGAQAEAAVLLSSGARFRFSTAVEGSGFHLTIVCVPSFDERDGLSADAVADVMTQLGPVLSAGELVSIESTMPIGATESILRPRLESASGLRVGRDVYLVVSPERIDTSLRRDVFSIPRVLGGATPACTGVGLARYRELVREIHTVSSARAAEASKILENAYRLVNIAFVNEVCELFDAHGLDPHEIVAAASTKPFGFAPFWPSVAAGGHCVPAAARALLRAGERSGRMPTVIAAALDVNDAGADRIVRLLGTFAGGRVLVAGLTYKSQSDQFACSRTLVIVEEVRRRGIDVTVTDSARPEALAADVRFVPFGALSGRYDAVVIAAWSAAAEQALRGVSRDVTLFLAGAPVPASFTGMQQHVSESLAVVG